MGGSSPGDPPDTVGAAREQGEQARKLNEAQTHANRPNQYNAWGSNTWQNTPTWDEATGQYINQWDQFESLDPQSQATLDSQRNISQGRTELAEAGMGRVWEGQQNPFDFDQYGDVIGFDPAEQRQLAEDASYQRSTSRLDPQFQQRQQQMETKLRNQGLGAGDQAYDAAMGNFSRGRNDAYEQARLGSVEQGRAETGLGMQTNELANALRTQRMNEGIFQREMPLNEVNRLLEGQAITGGPPSSGGETTIASGLQGS